MHKNEGPVDRIIRVILGLIFLALGYFQFQGTIQIVLFIFSGIMFFTALTGFCSLYKLFGIDTLKK